MKADLKAINFVKQFAKEFSGQLPAEEQPKTKKSGKLLSFILYPISFDKISLSQPMNIMPYSA